MVNHFQLSPMHAGILSFHHASLYCKYERVVLLQLYVGLWQKLNLNTVCTLKILSYWNNIPRNTTHTLL